MVNGSKVHLQSSGLLPHGNNNTVLAQEDAANRTHPTHTPIPIDIKLLNNHHFVEIALRCFSSWQSKLFLISGQLAFSHSLLH